MRRKRTLTKLVLLGLALGTSLYAGTAYAQEYGPIYLNGENKEYSFTTDDMITASTGDAICLENGAQSTLYIAQGTAPYFNIIAENGSGIYNNIWNTGNNLLRVTGPIYIEATKAGIDGGGWDGAESASTFDKAVTVKVENPNGIARGISNQGKSLMNFDGKLDIEVQGKGQSTGTLTIESQNCVAGILNDSEIHDNVSPVDAKMHFSDDVSITGNGQGAIVGIDNTGGEVTFDKNVELDLNGVSSDENGVMVGGISNFGLKSSSGSTYRGDVAMTLSADSQKKGHGYAIGIAAGTSTIGSSSVTNKGKLGFENSVNIKIDAVNFSQGGVRGISIHDMEQPVDFNGPVTIDLTTNKDTTNEDDYVFTQGAFLTSKANFQDDVTMNLKGNTLGCGLLVSNDIINSKNEVVFNGKVTITGDVTKDFTGIENEFGDIQFNDTVYIEDKGSDLSKSYRYLVDNTNGNIVFHKGVSLIQDNADKANGAVLSNGSSANVAINPENKAYDVQINGDLVAENKGSITAHLNNKNSILRGNIQETSGGIVNFSLGNGAVWQPSDDSSVTNLTLNKGSVIDFIQDDNLLSASSTAFASKMSYDFARTYKPRTLTIGNLYGDGGSFRINTDLANNTGDRLLFTGNVPNAAYDVYIKDASMGDGKNISGSHIIAEAEQGAGTGFTLHAQPVRYQGYYYQPNMADPTMSGNKLTWLLSGFTTTGGVAEAETGQDYIDTVLPQEFDDEIYKRFNDLHTDPSEVGVWLRGERGEMEISGINYDYSVTMGGYDWARVEEDKNLFAGIGIGYAKNKSDVGIIGDTSSTTYSLYASYFGKEKKDYVDFIVKYGNLDKEYAGLDSVGYPVSGSYDKHYYSIGLDYGRRFEKEKGWYWEPSAGFSYGHVGDATFTDSTHTTIHSDAIKSKVIKLGAQFGREIKGTDYYIKGTVLHDFDGKIRMEAPGASALDDQGGTWFKLLLGASRKVSNNSSLYLDIGKDFGNKVKKPWSISGGYRFTW